MLLWGRIVQTPNQTSLAVTGEANIVVFESVRPGSINLVHLCVFDDSELHIPEYFVSH